MKIWHKQYDFTPGTGKLLISEPFLSDPNFRKTVILLCEHEDAGSIGFVLNKSVSLTTDEVIPGLLQVNFPIFYGGPVEENSLHFIHTYGDFIPHSFPIGDGLYWGGELDAINELMQSGKATLTDFKFFIGYSGWGVSQLEDEIEQKAWWLGDLDAKIALHANLDEIWPAAVKNMGPDFAYLANAPEDFLWN
ncbi:MAG: YqgE/AlgH family protein [Sphingobacteriales bacterium]|jgi:putative transcriptional regulator|nr:YqgE/AlgH family protein [Sphingobacteriales bacterium]